MTTLSLQSTVLRRLLQQSASKNALRSGSGWFSAGSARSLTTEATEQEKAFQAKGFLDEHRLTVFDTLHEMQVRSCQVFAEKPLFGTYSDKSKEFEWMSFEEYDQEINKCRAVLKDIGKCSQVGVLGRNVDDRLVEVADGRCLIILTPSLMTLRLLVLQASKQAARLPLLRTTVGSGPRLSLLATVSTRTPCPCTRRKCQATGPTF